LVCAADLLKEAGLITRRHAYRCYVLVGWRQDTFDKAERRLNDVVRLGIMPMAMLFDHGEARQSHNDRERWIHFARNWANPWIVGKQMKLQEQSC
jgi:hypothetical protein